MDQDAATKAILAHWKAGWETLHPANPAHADHVKWVPANVDAGSASRWVRVTIRHTTTRQITQGQAPYRKWERRGRIAVDIFVPRNTGTELADLLTGHVRSVFEGESIGSTERVVTYEAPSEETAEEGQWYRTIVKVQFRYVETR